MDDLLVYVVHSEDATAKRLLEGSPLPGSFLDTDVPLSKSSSPVVDHAKLTRPRVSSGLAPDADRRLGSCP